MGGRVKDAEKDQARCADDGEEDGQPRQDLLGARGVGGQAAPVAQPAVGAKGDVEQDRGEGAAGDEQGLEILGANVADVGYALILRHGRVVDAVPVDDPVEEEGQEGGEPDCPTENGHYLRGGGTSVYGVAGREREEKGVPNKIGGTFCGDSVVEGVLRPGVV